MAGIDGSDGAPSRLRRTPKEGERIVAPTVRPDGTVRRPIRIRAGYTPPDEVAIYQPKGARLKKAAQPELPLGYDPGPDSKPKTKSAKRNERKKEKKLQAALAASDGKGKSLDDGEGQDVENHQDFEASSQRSRSLENLTSGLNKLSITATYSDIALEQSEILNPDPSPINVLDKKIRALKKKIRLTEALEKGSEQDMKPEQLEKLAKVAGWREELRILEEKKVEASVYPS